MPDDLGIGDLGYHGQDKTKPQTWTASPRMRCDSPTSIPSTPFVRQAFPEQAAKALELLENSHTPSHRMSRNFHDFSGQKGRRRVECFRTQQNT